MQAVQDANDRLRQMLRAMVTTKQSRSGLSSPWHSHQHQGWCHRAGGCSPAKGAQELHGGKAVRAHARKVAAAGQHHCQHHHLHCCHSAPCKRKAHRWQSQLSTVCPAYALACCATGPGERRIRVNLQLPSSCHHFPQNYKLATLRCLVCSQIKLRLKCAGKCSSPAVYELIRQIP